MLTALCKAKLGRQGEGTNKIKTMKNSKPFSEGDL